MSSIRDAVNLDLDAIVEASEALGYASRDSSDIESDLSELICSERDRLWVFEDHDGVVGWLHAHRSVRVASTAFIEICGMAVHPDYQRKGIGTALVSRAETWAAEMGLNLRVRCNSVREDTHKFYRNQGFSLVKNQLVLDRYL